MEAQIIHEIDVWLLSVYDQIQEHDAGVEPFTYIRTYDKSIGRQLTVYYQYFDFSVSN